MTISLNEWSKLDIRTGEILKIENIKDSDNLYKLEVDLGTETKTLVAGLKKYYRKEELEGKRCIVLCNLESKKIKGIKSQGMILAAVNDDKSEVKLIQPDSSIQLGSRIS